MALHRRFFAALARDFKAAKPAEDETPNEQSVWEQMVVITANALSAQNAIFKHDKFYEACGMPQSVIDRVASIR